MAKPPLLLDWSRVPVFLAVAETGSLSAAAKRLGQSQPTLGRQVRAMEEELGVSLFTRQPRGLVLTEAGAALLEPAQAMQESANRLAIAAAGQEHAPTGTVRLTASQVVSHHVLPPILARIRQAEPAIQIELAPTDASQNLLFREADLALRMYRPDQLDMIARHVGDLPLGMYAARSYLERHGTPQTLEQVFDRDVVGYDRDDRIIRGLRHYQIEVARTDFAVRCDDQVVHWELVRAGCGIGFAPVILGDADPGVTRLLPDAAMPVLGAWLTTHEAMRRTPRIRRVWDLLVAELTAILAPPTDSAGSRRAGEPAPVAPPA